MEENQMELIAARVRKLLALAENNPNEHEAAAAAEKAQAILEAYNLTTLDLNSDPSTKAREDTNFRGGLYKWQRDLWAAVARLNYCMYWSIRGLRRGQSYEHRVLGSPVNVLATRLMAEYLQQAVERLAREKYSGDPREYFRKAAIAYREGVTLRLVLRLEERRRKLEEEAEQKAKEEAARAAHPAYAGSSRALTILDVKQSEEDANFDYLYGEGASARMRARRAEILAEMQREREEFERWCEENPEEWAELQAKRAKEAEQRRKREEYNARRRKGTSGRGWQPRHPDFHDGYDDGGSISLEQQVDEEARKRIAQ